MCVNSTVLTNVRIFHISSNSTYVLDRYVTYRTTKSFEARRTGGGRIFVGA